MGIKIVFFDGEEAFGEWTATDSLYALFIHKNSFFKLITFQFVS
jgi:hypothetical protein